MSHKGSVLVVGQAADLPNLAAILTGLDYAVCAESSKRSAVAAATEHSPEIALVDLAMEGAADTARALVIDLGVSVVYLVATPDEPLMRQAQAADPLGYVLKPFEEGQLKLALDAALATRRRLAKPRSDTQFPVTHLLENIFQSVNEGVSVMNMDLETRYANPAGASLLDINQETAETRLRRFRFYRLDKTTPIPWEDLPQVRAVEFGESSDNFEAYVVPPHLDEGFFLNIDVKPLYDDEGRRRGCLNVYRDIGGQKAAESRLHTTLAELRDTAASLSEQTQTMETVFDGIADGVAVMDTAENVLYINKAASRIVTPDIVRDVPLGRSRTGIGVFYSDRVTPVPHDELPYVKALRGEPCDQMRFFLVHPTMPDGVLLSVSARVVQADGEAPVRVVLLFRDVTADYQQEQELLQAFSQGRLEVIDTVLHNVGNAVNSVTTGVGTLRERLTTPRLLQRLSAVAGALEAQRDDWIAYLRDDPQGSQVVPFLLALTKDWAQENAELERTVERVAERVDHIVDILRAQQSLDIGSTDRKAVLTEEAVWGGVRLLEESLNTRGISIRVDCTRAPKEIALQENRFHQMLVNLVRNCIDAIDALEGTNGAGGRPEVGIDSYVEDDHLYVDVTDNGIGIEPTNLDDIFRPGFTTKASGNGLGLHSAANYVMGSGGRITALSEGVGQGTTIRSWWPLPAMLPR